MRFIIFSFFTLILFLGTFNSTLTFANIDKEEIPKKELPKNDIAQKTYCDPERERIDVSSLLEIREDSTQVPCFSPCNRSRLIEKFNEKEIFKLSKLEIDTLVDGCENLTGPPEERGKIVDFLNSPYKKLEDSGEVKFALDQEALQIMRMIGGNQAPDPRWERFGLEVNPESDTISVFSRPEMFNPDFDLGKEAPNVSNFQNTLGWNRGTATVALLGTARLSDTYVRQLIPQIDQILTFMGKKRPGSVNYMTGGYSGRKSKQYGVTRAGFEVPKRQFLYTLMIMCKAGAYDRNQAPKALDFVGQHWGDDTQGLVQASDGAIFLRNIPEGRNYGAWTELEIANFVHFKKPLVILDPSIEKSSKTEVYFGEEVFVYREAKDAVAHLEKKLPSKEKLKARQSITITGELSPITQEEDGKMVLIDLQYKNIQKGIYKHQNPSTLLLFTEQGLTFPDETAPDSFIDLVFSGYWRDILFLQTLEILPDTGYEEDEDLIKRYKNIRAKIANSEVTEHQELKEWQRNIRKGHDFYNFIFHPVFHPIYDESWLSFIRSIEIDQK